MNQSVNEMKSLHRIKFNLGPLYSSQIKSFVIEAYYLNCTKLGLNQLTTISKLSN